MPRKPLPSVVLFVENVPRIAEFYRHLAAMAAVHADPAHVVLEVDGIQLVIHALRGASVTTVHDPVVPREDSYVKLCLPVDSIARARDVAATLGGRIHGVEKEWTARGFRACDGHDPEGNMVQVREGAL